MSGPLLCSYREAARVLGIGRNNTLPELIRRGLLRPVTLLGRSYIPREQLEELARHGEAEPKSSAEREPKRKRRVGGSIADMKL
ncbi:helix-turn-helix domain-containing protein [Archangium violaceum]|uniref:helix-turn-helix domain-containing protein n=1 Tax=Archangium violaceum TaxID=83451 RepID=UPI0036DBDC33